jgi:2'-5' RNA ligase
MRAFVALDLPMPAVAALERVQAALPAGRPVPSENLHLTLAFLGEVAEATLEEVHFALEALRLPGFEIVLAGLGMFGGPPASVHAVAEPAPGLVRLHAAVRRAVEGAGLALPRERFRPHVTIARLSRAPGPDTRARLEAFVAADAGFVLPPFAVTGFGLWRSTLTSGGAIHEALAVYRLG